jgi:hypothetical protein
MSFFVTAPKAGVPLFILASCPSGIPAFAGMTARALHDWEHLA